MGNIYNCSGKYLDKMKLLFLHFQVSMFDIASSKKLLVEFLRGKALINQWLRWSPSFINAIKLFKSLFDRRLNH